MVKFRPLSTEYLREMNIRSRMPKREAKACSSQIKRAARSGFVPIERILPDLSGVQSEILKQVFGNSVGKFLYVARDSASRVDYLMQTVEQHVCQYGLAEEFSKIANSFDPVSRAKLYHVLSYIGWHSEGEMRADLFKGHLSVLSGLRPSILSEVIDKYDDAVNSTYFNGSWRENGLENSFIKQISFFLNFTVPLSIYDVEPPSGKILGKQVEVKQPAPKFGGALEGRRPFMLALPPCRDLVPAIGAEKEKYMKLMLWGTLWMNCEKAIRIVKRKRPVDKERLSALKSFQCTLTMVQDLHAKFIGEDTTDRFARRFPGHLNAFYNDLVTEAKRLGIN